MTDERRGMLGRLDALQQRHRWAAFTYAVFQKFIDDQAGNLAALLAYYAFLSIFPLLLVLVTVLGFVLRGDPALEAQVYSSVVGQLPIIGEHDRAHPLSGSPTALVIGLVLAVWSGLGVAMTAQTAFNTLYGVAPVDWPAFPQRLVRGAELVLVAGGGLALSTVLQGSVGGVTGGVVGAVVGIVLNAVVFAYLFRRATVARPTWREVAPGAGVAAVAWFALQKVGTELVGHQIVGAQNTYGTFAVVIGLLFWFYLLAQITLSCVEINIVAARGWWPRGLPSLVEARSTTDADRRAVESYPHRDRQAQNLLVEARVTDPADRQRPATASPTDRARETLDDVGFPTDRTALIVAAAERRAEPELIDAIAALPAGIYGSLAEVVNRLEAAQDPI